MLPTPAWATKFLLLSFSKHFSYPPLAHKVWTPSAYPKLIANFTIFSQTSSKKLWNARKSFLLCQRSFHPHPTPTAMLDLCLFVSPHRLISQLPSPHLSWISLLHWISGLTTRLPTFNFISWPPCPWPHRPQTRPSTAVHTCSLEGNGNGSSEGSRQWSHLLNDESYVTLCSGLEAGNLGPPSDIRMSASKTTPGGPGIHNGRGESRWCPA